VDISETTQDTAIVTIERQ